MTGREFLPYGRQDVDQSDLDAVCQCPHGRLAHDGSPRQLAGSRASGVPRSRSGILS